MGDTLDRCVKLVEGLESPHLVFLWDPANFVQVGEARITERGWPLLGSRVGYVHIKDCDRERLGESGGVRETVRCPNC